MEALILTPRWRLVVLLQSYISIYGGFTALSMSCSYAGMCANYRCAKTGV